MRETYLAIRRLAAIVESSDDAIVSKTLDGTITSWNGAAELMFGYKPEEVIGQSVTILIPDDALDEEPSIIRRIKRGYKIDHYETVRKRKDGSLVEVSLTVSPLRDSTGEIVGASKILRDISDRKRSERVLRQAAEEVAAAKADLERQVSERTASLRDALAQMEEFSYTLSHDLRAPLRAMKMYSTVLLTDYAEVLADHEEAQNYLKRIEANAERLDKMILDVLTFGRVARNPISLKEIDLERFIREIIQHYPEMQPPAAEIIVEAPHKVIAHEASLLQAISNLLANAVKFVAPGVKAVVRVRSERIGEDVRLWFEDNGIGIDPSYHHRLFNMFERVHPNMEYEGTGVGLAIVRKSIGRMGGKAGVESDGRDGSKFWIQLPASQSSHER